LLEGMNISNLKILSDDSGSVMHAIKKTDKNFYEFGEVYFSTVLKDSVKAWKLHKEMVLNLVVPVGSVLFNFIDLRQDSKTFNNKCKIILSQDPYKRLTVPPNIWFGFKGLSEDLNLICNVANILHNPKEVLRKNIDEIDCDWSVK